MHVVLGLVALMFLGGCVVPVATKHELSEPLTSVPGDPERGRALVFNRAETSCVLCHAVPGAPGPAGNIGPPLAGTGARNTLAELRLRLVDPTRINPDSVMPAYHRVEGLERVATAFRGKPILTAQQIEDIVAYLATLKDSP